MQTIQINLPGREYGVTIGSGALELLPTLLRGRSVFVVTDSNVERLYGERLHGLLSSVRSTVAVIEPGERSKTVESASRLWSAMQQFGLRRGDLVVALGGGVIGDLAGFAASAYMRGVSYVQIPTTLVAQVDSSVGGKTAVNLPKGKNLVGAFYQPEAVLLDVDFLATLPEREFRAGLAECVKYALIGSEPLPPLTDLDALTAFCVRVKAAFVERDELDTGDRMFLNFGHTFGHAIEKKFAFERYNHGEAVALGMALALHAGVRLGVTPPQVRDDALRLIVTNMLDISHDFDPWELVPLMNSDKKNGSGTINLVLLREIGKPVVVPVKRLGARPSGVVTLPPSKSILHRRIICSALAGERNFSAFVGISDDIDATIRCMTAMLNGETTLDCNESGSTLRFLVPIAAALGRSVRFVGSGRLLERPLQPLLDALTANGITCELSPDALTISGQLVSAHFELPGDVSSQFVSGLLMAAPLIGGLGVALTSPLQSSAYVLLTLYELEKYGINWMHFDPHFISDEDEGEPDYYAIGDEHYVLPDGFDLNDCEADWSQAAFFLAANALGYDVELRGLNANSSQCDRIIAEVVSNATSSGNLMSAIIDVSEIPDLVPPLAAMFCFADGVTKFTNAGRLRLKESDRLSSVADAINALGGNAQIDGDTLVITGVQRLRGGIVNPCGDHRIAMMAAVLALRSDGDVWLSNPECVRKSYPDFWKDFERE